MLAKPTPDLSAILDYTGLFDKSKVISWFFLGMCCPLTLDEFQAAQSPPILVTRNNDPTRDAENIPRVSKG